MKKAKPKPMVEPPTNNRVLFESTTEDNQSMVFFLTHDFLVHDINQSDLSKFFEKEKRELIDISIIDLLREQHINTDELLAALEPNSNQLLHSIFLEHRRLNKKYSATIIALNENTLIKYIITLNEWDDTYRVLDSNLNAIINNLPGAVYWKDREGRYLGCNKFVATMAGFATPEEMIGKTDYDLCWHEFADEWRQLDNMVMLEDTTIEREERAKLANGKIITELTFKTTLKNQQSETIGIIGTSLDITGVCQESCRV